MEAKLDLALGTMFFGTRLDERTCIDLLDQFVGEGGALIDTANSYAFWVENGGVGGQSERVIGRWLTSRPDMRDRVYLSTKVGADPSGPGQWPANAEGLSASVIRAAAQASLDRLRTDWIDLYWAHMEDRSVPLQETVGAMADLAATGTVRRLGCSNHPLWRVERAREIARINGCPGYSALQLRYSYLQPRPGVALPEQSAVRFGWVTDETIDYVQSNPGLSLWAYTPLLRGAYSRTDRSLPEGYQHPGTSRRLEALAAVAQETGATRNQVVLAWLIGGLPHVIPIVGVSTAAQLDEAIAGALLTLSSEQRQHLNDAL
jgi:aryl-alcohol dehydrogenase-like predicted oxidoreductase